MVYIISELKLVGSTPTVLAEEDIADEGQELVTENNSSSDTCSSVFDSTGDASTASVHDNRGTSTVGNSQALMSTSFFQNGSSIFQG